LTATTAVSWNARQRRSVSPPHGAATAASRGPRVNRHRVDQAKITT